jgi:superfamily II DNA or RNA helicase
VLRYKLLQYGLQQMLSPDRFIASCRSWSDFWDRARELSKIEKGRAFERLTQLYLQTVPEYRTELKHIWLLSEVPGDVRRRLKLPGPRDEGIDLIARTRRGEYWAIQTKFRSERDKPLSRGELATFSSLAFHTCNNIALAVVAHTATKPVGKRHLLPKTVEIGFDRWRSLDDDAAWAWQAILAQLKGQAPRPKARSPRPYQQAAISAAKNHFIRDGAARGRLIMPCGTGKSLTAFWIADALDAKAILVAVPSLVLISQSLRDWAREFLAQNVMPDWLCVCSDESVGELESDKFVGEVYDLGLPTHTEPNEIAKLLRARSSGPKIVFTTYQSSRKLAAAARKAGTKFDLAIIDEAHKTVGLHSKTFATVLSDKKIKIGRRLFMTATERVFRGDRDDVLSMDDEGDYGPRFYQLSFKDAIRQGIISDYKILTMTVSDGHMKQLIDQNHILNLNSRDLDDAEAQAVAAGIALKRTYRNYQIKHAISFHRSIRAADRFREQQDALNRLRDIGPRTTNLHISSKKAAGQRSELLQEFVRYKRSLITNARCLTEGVDIPSVDCVMFADPKQSRIDIVQAAGRALRNAEGKEFGYIVLPLIVPEKMDFAEFAETTAFRQVVQTITALSTQDERITAEFRAIERGQISSGKIIEIDGDVAVGMKIKLGDFAAAISTRIWDSVGRVNWRVFDDARNHARSLHLKNSFQWKIYARSNERPPDIPVHPAYIYRRDWRGWKDWLGRGRSPPIRKTQGFAKARAFARSLGLKSFADWRAFARSSRRPEDIPTQPWKRYRNKGWNGIDDWLGTSRKAPIKTKMSFVDARAFARSLKLKSLKEWNAFASSGRLPSDIPADPAHAYKGQGWVNLADWLGTERRVRSYQEARAFVRKLGLQSAAEWREWSRSGKRPPDIPSAPDHTYANDGWLNWFDWLGNAKPKRPFVEARAFIRSLGLKSIREWKQYAASKELPFDIPARPQDALAYGKEGWAGYDDWLGKRKVKCPFAEARAFARSLKLKTVLEWQRYTRSKSFPPDIPKAPDQGYAADGWIDWGDWLGTGRRRNWRAEKRPFKEARAFIRSLHLTNWRDFASSGKRPKDIPASPDIAYANEGWAGFEDWMGTQRQRYLPFKVAREFARSLHLVTQREWQRYCKSHFLPSNILKDPRKVYAKDGWIGFPDWLGSDQRHNTEIGLSTKPVRSEATAQSNIEPL